MHPRAGVVGLLAVVLITAACGHVEAGGNVGDAAPATEPVPTPEPVVWDVAWLEGDGVTLRLSVEGPGEGDGPCGVRYGTEVDESPARVTVTVGTVRPVATPAPDEEVACAGIGYVVPITVGLTAPLGDRPLYDGTTDAPRWVARESETVEPSWLPSGFTLGEPGPYSTGTERRIDQMADAPDADWYVSLSQEVASGEGSPWDGLWEELRLLRDLTVHGQPARLYEDTGFGAHYVIWREKGWDITVRGEMQKGPPFTHGDEVLRIADELVVPSPPTVASP
jgi:hypothetical protein